MVIILVASAGEKAEHASFCDDLSAEFLRNRTTARAESEPTQYPTLCRSIYNVTCPSATSVYSSTTDVRPIVTRDKIMGVEMEHRLFFTWLLVTSCLPSKTHSATFWVSWGCLDASTKRASSSVMKYRLIRTPSPPSSSIIRTHASIPCRKQPWERCHESDLCFSCLRLDMVTGHQNWKGDSSQPKHIVKVRGMSFDVGCHIERGVWDGREGWTRGAKETQIKVRVSYYHTKVYW